MAKTKYTFERTEKKYLLTQKQADSFFNEIKNRIKPDSYGKYTVYNIYYDTESDYLIRNSLEKPSYKEKLRLRSYGPIDMEDMAFLEIKKKYDGVVYKRRIDLKLKDAMDYLNKGKKPAISGQIFNEIDYFINFYKVKPKLFIAYDRVAFSGVDDGSLRITIDKNIRSRTENLTLTKQSCQNELLMTDQCLMEIKVFGAYPLWLSGILSQLQIFPTSFSKYGAIYQKNLQKIRSNKCLQVS